MYPGSHARTGPDKAAVVMGASGRVVTYGELDEGSSHLAHVLRDSGMRPGDHVAFLAENHPRYFEVYWAALRSGLYLTAVNRYLAPGEIEYLLRDSGATALIASHSLAERAAAVRNLVPECDRRWMFDGVVDGFASYEAAVANAPGTPLLEQPRGDVMLYSSGTTGRPKGILRPLSGLSIDDPAGAVMAERERRWLGMDESSIYLCPAPLYHAAGLSWSAGVHELGGTVVVMEHFDAEAALALIERERITHAQFVPTMFVRMLKLPPEVRGRYDLSSLECVLHAAAPCPPAVKAAMLEWLGPIIHEYYSGTEGNGVTFITAAEWLEHPGSVGRPVLGVPHICDESGAEVPVGETGIVYFELDVPAFEYHADPDRTRAAYHPVYTTWSTLGDIGHLDSDGYLYLTDRQAFMVISGGVNIYPAEVESCLIMHPAVADVAVFGLPDPDMGERVHAAVELVDGYEPSDGLADELQAYAREQLARYKVPREITFEPELPRLPTGKLYKQPVRDAYLERLTP